MTSSQVPETQHVPASGPLSLWQVIKESTRLYLHHWKAFTQVLVAPMFFIMSGLYANIIVMYWAPQNFPGATEGNLWLFILAVIATFIWFCIGTWKYAVYFGSLNINARDIIDGKPAHFRDAYQSIAKTKAWPYKTLLTTTYAILPVLALITMLGFGGIGGFYAASGNPLAYAGLQLAGLLISGAIMLIWMLSLIPLSFVVQIAMLEEGDLNPVRIFKRSARLVFNRIWATLGLQTFLFLATNYIVPMPIAFLCRKLSLTLPLDRIHQWIASLFVDSLMKDAEMVEPNMTEAISSLQGMIPHLTEGWTDVTIMLVITAFLLPWGSFAFTLLYRDIIKHAPASLKADPTEVNFHQAAEREAS